MLRYTRQHLHTNRHSVFYLSLTVDQVMLRYGARDDASLLLQYGFVMGGARGEANPHGPLPAALRAALRMAEPARATEPVSEPEAKRAEAAEPAAESEVSEPVAVAVAAGGGGGHAPACKRQRVVG